MIGCVFGFCGLYVMDAGSACIWFVFVILGCALCGGFCLVVFACGFAFAIGSLFLVCVLVCALCLWSICLLVSVFVFECLRYLVWFSVFLYFDLGWELWFG